MKVSNTSFGLFLINIFFFRKGSITDILPPFLITQLIDLRLLNMRCLLTTRHVGMHSTRALWNNC